MEDFAPSSSLCSSPDNTDENENKVVPSSAAQLPTASTTRGIRNVRTVLISSIFCLFIRWGLPRLINLFNSNSSSASAPETQNVADPTPGRPYDVFLNHRGPDVKISLASLIYHWLEDKGLRVFLDQQEFLAGEELNPTIEQAISSASVHIAIFSKRYVESSWCLDELCSMLKSGAKIIPVFYDVQPYELRWIGKGKGVYVSAFAKHQKKRRVPSQKLDEWKAALERVSYMHGLELNGPEFHGDMGKLLKSIANTVTEAVAEKVPLESAKDTVGLDDAVEDFQNFMQSEAHDRKEESVKIVGIVGFGGSGKTTLAKEFYRIHRTSFSASSFLSEVRHAATQHKLQNLQGKLLNDLLHISDHSIERSSVSDGRAILSNRLRSSTPRVLVILDDIDDENQVECLLDKDVLGSGSLILMTSREEGGLRRSGADSVYKIKPLKSYHALELFCRHAFQQPCPRTGFEDLAEKFCGKCRGFPLFLKVIGAHLRDIGKDSKSVWNDELEYIPDGIKYILKFSYDALAIEEKQMFLDVACFFLGMNKNMAIRVWKGYDRRASTRLQNLERRCLVEVDDENCLKMHDHLRDFGREIAEQESCCRFWHPSQILNIREQLKGRRQVRGIMTSLGEFPSDLRLDSTFEEIELSSLKFLCIEGDCFESRFGQQATNLMWLRWRHCPHTNFPSRFISMKNLTVLHLYGRILAEWEICDSQLPLKELAIQKTRLSCLSIDEDICPQLEHLDLSANDYLERVEHLPTTLVLLNLGYCIKLKSISASFHLKKLQSLDIQMCRQLEELPDLKHLTSLETFDARGCSKLQNIQGLEHLSKLRYLSVYCCSELGELPNLSGLTSLETLQATGCSKLQNIQGLQHLSKLRYLSVYCCSELGELPNLSGLTSLETLTTSGCSKLQSIQGLEHLSKLRLLNVNHCFELGQLPNLSGLTSMNNLLASGWSKLQNLQGLENLSKLRCLNVSKCCMLGELPNLSGLTSLETLQARGCSKLQNIQGLQHLSRLRYLNVSGCCMLGELPNLSGLTSLETFDASGCSKLQNIQGLERLSKLRYLSVDCCSELRELPNLSSLTSLETLQASGCSKLQNIQGLEHLSKLRIRPAVKSVE